MGSQVSPRRNKVQIVYLYGHRLSLSRPASPSSARRARPASAEEDEDAASAPSLPSQIDGDGDDDIDDECRAHTEPVVPTLADVDETDMGMSECVSKVMAW